MTDSWAGGKGSRARLVNRKKWDEGYERAFGKKIPVSSFWKDLWALEELVDETNESCQENKNGR